jgi:tyrosine-specific transport protein
MASSRSTERVFSNIKMESGRYLHEPGNVLSASVLVAGTAVGAGILALPQALSPAGMVPAFVSITGSAVYSILTGLLVAEVCVNTLCELGSGSGVSIGSMAERTLGAAGSNLVRLTYLFLHYTLLVAYTSKAGSTISSLVGGDDSMISSALFTVVIGGLCAGATPRQLDGANNALVLGVVGSFLFLVANVSQSLDVTLLPTALREEHWELLIKSLPVVALSFVFQNVVPVICSTLEGDLAKIRTAIIAGVGVPWFMFSVWTFTILLASQGADAVLDDPLAALRTTPSNALLIDGFSLLAVSTSYIGFVLGLKEFLLELLGLTEARGRTIVYPLVLIPPLVLALSFPGLFYQALEFAGAYGVLTLFGIIPVLMAWAERYGEDESSQMRTLTIVPAGKPLLVALLGASAGIIIDQALSGLLE